LKMIHDRQGSRTRAPKIRRLRALRAPNLQESRRSDVRSRSPADFLARGGALPVAPGTGAAAHRTNPVSRNWPMKFNLAGGVTAASYCWQLGQP
jgi:hypothetical protein